MINQLYNQSQIHHMDKNNPLKLRLPTFSSRKHIPNENNSPSPINHVPTSITNPPPFLDTNYDNHCPEVTRNTSKCIIQCDNVIPTSLTNNINFSENKSNVLSNDMPFFEKNSDVRENDISITKNTTFVENNCDVRFNDGVRTSLPDSMVNVISKSPRKNLYASQIKTILPALTPPIIRHPKTPTNIFCPKNNLINPKIPNNMEGPRTPSLNNMEGPRTPSLNKGPRTPSLNKGPRTPSLNKGPRTPTLNNREGPRTPTLNNNKGPRTPSLNNREGPRTPSLNNREGPRTPSLNNNKGQRTLNDSKWPKTPNKMECPRTPLINPKIGFVKGKIGNGREEKRKGNEENPWIVINMEKKREIKITAITPIGTIAMVPTTDIRPETPRRNLPVTPNRNLKLKVIDDETGDVKIDALLKATIYLDLTKPEDKDYNYVANKMRSITNNTISLQKQYSNELQELPKIYGKVTHKTFEKALSVYENNQVFYQDKIDDKTLDINVIKERLTELEHWFMCVIEPVPTMKNEEEIKEWKEREKFKINRGISSYCDPELYTYITPAGDEIKAFISMFQ